MKVGDLEPAEKTNMRIPEKFEFKRDFLCEKKFQSLTDRSGNIISVVYTFLGRFLGISVHSPKSYVDKIIKK